MPQFNLDHFIDFNSNISSEMFVSVMTILHERLPCAQFYFRQHKLFKQNHQEKLMNFGSADGDFSDNKVSEPNTSPFQSPEIRGEKRCVTAIASPNLIRGYSPSVAKNETSEHRVERLMAQQKLHDSNSEFRIKYSSKGAKDSPVRNKAIYNSQNSAQILRMSSERFPQEKLQRLGDSSKMISENDSETLIEISKMRKLEEARKQWESRHASNSPFRADQFSASPLVESTNSPFTISKVYGMRHGLGLSTIDQN